jgi:hypothetical protein
MSVVLLDSPESGGGEEAIVGSGGLTLCITKGSGSALDCGGSSLVVVVVVVVIVIVGSFGSSSPKRK